MRTETLATTILTASLLLGCGSEDVGDATARSIAFEDRIVDASCGQCQLGLPGVGCDLAIAFEGGAYYVDGSHIDDHGDAHGPDGLCNAIRPAHVTGRLVGDRFVVERMTIVTDGD